MAALAGPKIAAAQMGLYDIAGPRSSGITTHGSDSSANVARRSASKFFCSGTRAEFRQSNCPKVSATSAVDMRTAQGSVPATSSSHVARHAVLRCESEDC